MAKKKEQRPLTTRGYEELSERIQKGAKFLSDCRNCDFYYLDSDNEEVCNHPSVLPYDVVVDDTRIFCAYWQIVKYNKRENNEDESKVNKARRRVFRRINKNNA